MASVAEASSPVADHRRAARCTVAAEVAALQRLHDGLDGQFDLAAQALVDIRGKLITLGVGKSGLAAQKVAATMRSVGLPAVYLNASDSLHGDLGVVTAGDVVIMFSKSGTTREVIQLIPHLRSRGATLIAIVGNTSSPMGVEADIALDGSVEAEGCPLDVAPMASVITAIAIGDALAAAVTTARGFTHDDFARLHPAGALGARLTLTVADVMRRGDDLPAVPAGSSLRDAVIEITRTGYGAVCVLEADGTLAGFLTDGDIRRALLRVDNLAETRLDELMTAKPLTVSPELPLSQALLLLEQRKKPFLTAPVTVDGDRCVGLLRLHDTVQAHLKS